MVDPDLDPPAGGILAASLPIGGRLDHRPRQQRLRRIRLIALDPAAALDQLRMKRPLHPTRVALELPST
jgi:hypothetical protein